MKQSKKQTQRDLISQSFITWITAQLDSNRLENYQFYEKYYNGEHDYDPPAKVKEALESNLGIVDNFCRVIVDTPPEYINGGGEIGIECKKPDGTPYPEAEAVYYQIYEQNGFLFDEIINVITQMGTFGDAFIRMYIENNNIRLAVDRPEQVFPRYSSSNYRDLMWLAYKWFDREVESTNVSMKSQTFYPDHIELYELGTEVESVGFNMFQTQKTQWQLVDSIPNPLGFIPVVHLRNNASNGLEYGTSDLQPMVSNGSQLGLQDLLNKTFTDMSLNMDNQAFQRLILWGGNPGKQKLYLGPGSVLEIPNEQGHMEVIPAETIAPYLMAIEQIIDHICAVTSIPRLTFMRPQGFPISGFALKIHSYPLERKCKRKEIVLNNGLKTLNRLIAYALALVTGVDMKSTNPSYGIKNFGGSQQIDIRDAVTKIHWNGGLPVDVITDAQVHSIRIQNRTESRYKAMEESGVENIPEEMQRMNQEYFEQLQLQLQMQAMIDKAQGNQGGSEE